MAQNFIGCDRDQSFLLPPDVRDWLPDGHLAWFVLDAVAGMDLSEFYGAYRRDGVGRRAYDPAMVVALLLYGYSRGVRSARAIERACVEDVAFKMIAMLETPDHATIARFVARHELALAALFGQVLGLCAQAGLVRPGVVAIDGTKMAGNASRESTRDFGQIAREIIAEAIATDEAEDELYGQERGDELPEELRTREGRAEFFRRVREQQASDHAPDEPGLLPDRADGPEDGFEFDVQRIVARHQDARVGHGRGAVSLSSAAGNKGNRSRATVRIGCCSPPSDLRSSVTPSWRPTVPMRTTGRVVVPRTAAGLASVRTRGRRRRCPTMWSASATLTASG
jgi:transposase